MRGGVLINKITLKDKKQLKVCPNYDFLLLSQNDFDLNESMLSPEQRYTNEELTNMGIENIIFPKNYAPICHFLEILPGDYIANL